MATSLVLQPYVSRRELGIFSRITLGVCLVLVAAFYGLLCSLLPPQLLTIPATPIIFLTLLILWMMPDIGGVRYALVGKLLVLFVGFNAMWPNFVAVNLPGLPWITPTRFLVFGMLAAFAFNFATSAEMRTEVNGAMDHVPVVRRLYWLFWATTLIAIPLSATIFDSLSKFLNNQIFWTVMLLASAWLASREGFAMRIARVMTWTVIVISVISLYEYRVADLFWLRWLPSWLKADELTFFKLGLGSTRYGSDVYRVRGPFGNALYFAEYLSITLPFVIYFLTRAKTLARFLLLVAGSFAVISIMFFTGSRSGMIGILSTMAIYGLLEAIRIRRQHPGSLAANAALFAYPIFAAGLVSVVIFSRRVHVLVIGGYQTQGSTDARATQWAMGWPKIISHPFGHGAATSGNVLGYYNPGQLMPTVDSYYLTLLLDYGFIGLASFMGLILTSIWIGFRAHNRARSEEALLLAPITIALVNFIIIKSAASTESHMPIIFILIGCMVALVRRQPDENIGAAPAVLDVVAAERRRSPVFATIAAFRRSPAKGVPEQP